jgi:hypothetical protein
MSIVIHIPKVNGKSNIILENSRGGEVCKSMEVVANIPRVKSVKSNDLSQLDLSVQSSKNTHSEENNINEINISYDTNLDRMESIRCSDKQIMTISNNTIENNHTSERVICENINIEEKRLDKENKKYI